ncbi:IS1380 family transposase [Nitrospinota bacterium]
MGEATNGPLRLDFDRRLKLEFRGATITSDAGLLVFRELDEALGLSCMAAEKMMEGRLGKNIQHPFVALFRQAVFGRLAGYEDVNDAERLRLDPAMRALVGRGDGLRHAASTSEMARFETELLAMEENLEVLSALSGLWIGRVHERTALKDLVLDMDSSDSPTFSQQEGSIFNGHFRCTCYHPLFVFNQFGDLERAVLRPGNVHSSKGWREALEPVVARHRGQKLARSLRADAAFARPEVYEFLEAEGFSYAIRLPANQKLQEAIGHMLTRHVGRPPLKPQIFYTSFRYRAKSWKKPRRVVAKVEWHRGELFPRVGFVVTNLRWHSRRVVHFYNKRGTAEQWIKEGKHAIRWTRLSCQRFQDNAVRLQLFALAYNLGNFLRTLALPEEVKHWSLTTLREKLIKIGAKVVRHGCYLTFQLAEVAVLRGLFEKIFGLIAGLGPWPIPREG